MSVCSVTYVMDSLDGDAVVFLDANTLSEDGTIAVRSQRWTEDGSICAVSLSKSGSDWVTIRVCSRSGYELLLRWDIDHAWS